MSDHPLVPTISASPGMSGGTASSPGITLSASMSRGSAASAVRVAVLLLTATLCLAGRLPAEEAPPSEDHAADPVAALQQADAAFNRAALERRKEAAAAWLADDAVFFSDVPNRGRDAFLAAWSPLWTGKFDFTYRATSRRAFVAASGELGFTLGEAETRFQHPAEAEPSVTEGHYLNVWVRDGDGPWRVRASSTLVVHPEWGAARDPRSGLMTAWPELAESLDAKIAIEWTPEEVIRAGSDELAVSLGAYDLEVEKGESRIGGGGHFLAVWQRDEEGKWQLAGEGMTPPNLGENDG